MGCIIVLTILRGGFIQIVYLNIPTPQGTPQHIARRFTEYLQQVCSHKVVYKGILDFTMTVCIYQGEPPLHPARPLVKSKFIAGIKSFPHGIAEIIPRVKLWLSFVLRGGGVNFCSYQHPMITRFNFSTDKKKPPSDQLGGLGVSLV